MKKNVIKKSCETTTYQNRTPHFFNSKNEFSFSNYLNPKLISYDEN